MTDPTSSIDNPWYSGSVSEAVHEATTRNAVFLVYVHDETDESQRMSKITSLPEAAATIKKQTVALKLLRSSEEATLFSQLFPILRVPSVYMIRSGVVLQYIPGVVTEETLVLKINEAVSNEIQPPFDTPPAEIATSIPLPANPDIIAAIETPSESSSQPSPSIATSSSSHSGVLEEERKTKAEKLKKQIEERRRQRDKEDRDAEARRELDRRSQGKLIQETTRILGDKDAKKAADDIAKEKRDKQEAKKRVQAQIELDKIERQARRQDELALRQQQVVIVQESLPVVRVDHCNLNIRLLDGTTIRNKFQASHTLDEVKKWIEENRTDGKAPFILIQTHPSRQFTISDETKPLKELELCPSNTLICKPSKHVSMAYSSGGGPGWGIISSGVSLVRNIIGTIFSYINPFAYGRYANNRSLTMNGNQRMDASATGQESASENSSLNGRKWGSNVRTLSHPDDEEDRRWTYNGNSTNQQ